MDNEMTNGDPAADMTLAKDIARRLESPEASERAARLEGCRYCDMPHPSGPCGCGHGYHGHSRSLEPGLGSRCLSCMCDSYASGIPSGQSELGRTPCSDPPCEETSPCAWHDEEQAHAEGLHEYCGIACEVQMPTEPMYNFIVACGLPGTRGILDELLRRAALKGPTEQSP